MRNRIAVISSAVTICLGASALVSPPVHAANASNKICEIAEIELEIANFCPNGGFIANYEDSNGFCSWDIVCN